MKLKNLTLFLLIVLFVNCNNAVTNKKETDFNKLFEAEVENASKDMLKVKSVKQLTGTNVNLSSENNPLSLVDYEVTLELTNDAWRLLKSDNTGSSHYKLYKNKPKSIEYYGRGLTPKLLKKGETYKIIRTLKQLK